MKKIQTTASSGLKKVASEHKVANFQRRRLSVLTISIMSPNFPKMGVFNHKCGIFGQNVFDKKIFGQFSIATARKIREHAIAVSRYDATGFRQQILVRISV